MAELEIAPLQDRLSDEEIAQLANALKELGVPSLPPNADDGTAVTVGDGVDDDVLTEFMERLDAHDLAAEIYLPIEFDGVVAIGKFRVGSLPVLLDILDEVKEELDVEEEEADDESEDEGDDDEDEAIEEMSLVMQQLRRCWKLFHTAAHTANDKHQPMHVSG